MKTNTTMTLLESSHWRLWLDPAMGVQWAAAQARRGDDWLSVLPDCRPEADTDGFAAGQSADAPLPAANFHMLPYSNRIRDGQFGFEGQSHQLDGAEKHAIHGALRKCPWQILEQNSHSITCIFETANAPAINWPWPIKARLRYSLDGPRLLSEMSLTNLADSSMPAGMGWHPYFVREIDGAQPELTLPVTAVFPDATGDCLPDGEAIALPESLDFRQARKLDPDQRIDCCLAGLAGDVRIAWPAAKLALTMRSSENCRFLVLFNPDMPHFAVEPVTNANDGFNLQARSIDAGVQTVQPGETLFASMAMTLE